STLALIDDILNTWGRLDVWVCSSGLLGPPSIALTTPSDLQKCFEANSYAPFFALKYAPPAMRKLCEKRNYPNAEVKDIGYGSIVVVGSVAAGYGGTNVRINHISPGQIDVGVDLAKFDMRGMTAQLPPSSLQTKEVSPFSLLPLSALHFNNNDDARSYDRISHSAPTSASNVPASRPKLRV
ncbi:MAG: hypothetical protein Q9211_004361, partial [Gyalolechia sp. 1 TL-2023]